MDLILSVTDTAHVVGRDLLPDRLPCRGPLSGIATALEMSETDTNLVIAVDLPFLTTELLGYLKSRAELSSDGLVACKIGSDFPLCLAIRRTLLPQILGRLADDELSIQGLIENTSATVMFQTELARAGFDSALFRNINTEQDYRSALG